MDPGAGLPRGLALGCLPGVVGVLHLRLDLHGGKVGVDGRAQGLGQLLEGFPE